MSRAQRTYADRHHGPVVVAGAVDISEPVAGYYRGKLRSNGIVGGIKLSYGPPLDPVTGEQLDRSWRWQALFNGDPVEFDDVWPKCAGDRISADDYRTYVKRQRWAQVHAPQSAYADPRKRHDPLSLHSPLPF